MNIKKLTALVCALTMAVSFAACGESESSTDKAVTTTASSVADSSSESSEAVTDPDADTQPESDILDTGECGENGDNVIYTIYKNGLMTMVGTGKMKRYGVASTPYWNYLDSIKEVTISDGVTNIGMSIFFNAKNLTSITIPNSVTSIDQDAFNGCESLASITIPDSVTTIENQAFFNCPNLKSATIPSSVTEISSPFGYYDSDSGFCKYDDFKIICEKDSKAYKFAVGYEFKYELAVDSDEQLGNALISVDCGIGRGEMYVFTVYDSNVATITNGERIGTSPMTEPGLSEYQKTIQKVIISDGFTFIANKAFADCSGLESVEIPSSITKIGGEAFSGCSSLTSIKIPSGVTNIENGVFSGCSSLTSIEIPNGVKEIYQYAFDNCSGLKSIEIPDSVKRIERYAFGNCTGLTTIVIPSSVTTIDESAFGGCPNLTIQCMKDSYAEKYAQDNNLKYEIIG